MLWPFKVIATRLGTRCRVLLADLRGAGSEGHDDDAEPYDGAEVRQPLGLFARPRVTASLVAWAVRMGDQVKPLFLTDKSQAPFTDLDEGETDLYNDAVRVRLRASGDVELGAGATKGVARAGDPIRADLSVTVANSGGVATVTLAWTDHSGMPHTLSMGFTGSAALDANPALSLTTDISGTVKTGSASITAKD